EEKTAATGTKPAPGKADKLGLVVSSLTAQEKKQLGIAFGVKVESAQGSAAQAGINEGDVVVRIGRTDIQTVAQYEQLVNQVKKGQQVALLVRRGESASFLVITP
ncbi:MAG: PDZ domain-containing protein, partial [Limnobacter sp.]|nr:PDZ domain-containing protein [Limnobacter sp.]